MICPRDTICTQNLVTWHHKETSIVNTKYFINTQLMLQQHFRKTWISKADFYNGRNFSGIKISSKDEKSIFLEVICI